MNTLYDHQATLSESHRKATGTTYTPSHVADKVVALAFEAYKGSKAPRVLDLGCGTGVFLDSLVRQWRWKEDPKSKIEGCDIDQEALSICRSRGFTVHESSFLDLEGRYDIIVGNPPYIRVQNLSKEVRSKIDSLPHTFGDSDLYLAAIDWALAHAAVVSFITPSSWKSNHSAKLLRGAIAKDRLLSYFYDYGDTQLFPGKQTYVAISTFTKDNASFVYETSGGSKIVPYPVDEYSMFHEEKEGNKLGDICDVRIGLATLADKVFYTNQVFPESVPCVKGSKTSLERKHIIFPYKDGALIPEHELSSEVKEYLEAHRAQLEARSCSDNTQWYEYGRTQGFNNFGPKIILPPIQKDVKGIVVPDEFCLYISGYAAFPKEGYSLQDVMSILNTQDYHEYIQEYGKPMQNGWRGINKKLLINYTV